MFGAAAILVLIALAAIATWVWQSFGSAAQPRIAIAAADGTPLSRQVANTLTLALPSLRGPIHRNMSWSTLRTLRRQRQTLS